MAELTSIRRQWLTVGLMLGFFLVVYPVLPKGVDEIQGEAVRWTVSVVFFSVGILLVFCFPLIGLPFVIGVVPILLVLRSAGAIYGRGVDLFYLVVAFVAWYKLPPGNLGQRVRIHGRVWLLLFLAQCIVQVTLEAAGSGTLDLTLPVQFATFYLMIYVISVRMSQEAFRLALYALATSCATLLVWMSSRMIFLGVLETRLGEDLGVNPNLISQFAIYLMCSILLLLVLRQEQRISAFFGLALLFGAVVIFFSQSRVALVQLSLVLLVLFLKFRTIRSLITVAYVVIVAVLLARPEVIVDVAASVLQSQQYQRLTRFELESRNDLNLLAWQLAAEHPAFGVGPGNYVQYSLASGLEDFAGIGSYHHNAIAGTAAEFGFVGLSLFLLWFFSFLRSCAVGCLYSVFVVAFSALEMADGVTHGSFLGVFGSLPFLFAILIERFGLPAKSVRARRSAGSQGAYVVTVSTRPSPHPISG